MTASNVTDKRIAKVLDDYLSNARKYAETRRARDFVAGNPFARKLSKAAIKLRHEFGQKGRNALASLMDDDDLIVRNMAAIDTLDFCSEKAQRVLLEISTQDAFEGPGAEWVLKEWRAGRREFPGGPVKPEITLPTRPDCAPR